MIFKLNVHSLMSRFGFREEDWDVVQEWSDVSLLSGSLAEISIAATQEGRD